MARNGNSNGKRGANTSNGAKHAGKRSSRNSSPMYSDRSNGKRGKREDEGRQFNDKGRTAAGVNDVSWYTHYPNLLVAAGSFPYPNRPGMLVATQTGVVPDPTKNKKGQWIIPGVMSLSWAPSFGRSNLGTDPASVVAKEVYAKVRKAYAGSLEADAPDFFMYLGALDSIFSFIAALRRLYRVLNKWSPDNYDLPNTLLAALGVDETTATTLRSERVKLWQYINDLTLQSRKFTCPAVMDLFNRHFWMNDNVYTDAATINSQMYVFRQAYFYQYAPLNNTSGDPASGLKLMPTPIKASATADSLYAFGLGLINALVAWDDAYTINGYLARAFDGVSNFIVDETVLDNPFNPIYSEEVLTQIENSRPLGILNLNVESCNVTQNTLTNAVVCNPTATGAMGTLIYKAMKSADWKAALPCLSIRSDNPSVADSVIATRLQANWVETATADTFDVIAATEIPLSWEIHKNNDAVHPGYYPLFAFDQSATDAPIADFIRMLQAEAFDWHPLSFCLYKGSGGTYENIVLGDVHNITFISIDDLRNLHRICIYSELNAFSI